ncbi:MAG: response regulator [Chitinophagaceae bacterium]|nr:MAG: response regulator [Chitinophagaceae bacterium]
MEKSIFIFDDDTDILELCRILLSQKGYTVHTSGSCTDIVEQVIAKQPGVILMDNKIPDTGGIIAVKTLKSDARTSSVPVIFFSANTNVKELSEQAGADHFLQKPFDISSLESMVSKTIRG